MTAQLPGTDARLDDLLAWCDHTVEEAWARAAEDGETASELANAFDITDLQHWLDLCA